MSGQRDPTPAAFEITKGTLDVLTLSEADVEACIDPAALLDALEQGFRDLERGRVQSPGRPQVTIPEMGFCLAMPGWRPGDLITVKVVSVFEGNLARGLPSHLATILLLDPETGVTRCTLDGTFITAVRTAAAAVLSARLLSRPDARVATVVGAGVQGREHLRLLPHARDLERIDVCSLRYDDAVRLAALSPIARPVEDLQAAVSGSDIVCLATSSPTPVIDAGWVQPGTHVTSIGYHPPDGELPPLLLGRGRVVVESLEALQPAPVGCAELAGVDPVTVTTLGAVALDRASGPRRDDAEITIYKAMGIALEDLVAANLAYRNAVDRRIGTTVPW